MGETDSLLWENVKDLLLLIILRLEFLHIVKRSHFYQRKRPWMKDFGGFIRHELIQMEQYMLCWNCQSFYNRTTCGFTCKLTNPPTIRTVGSIRRMLVDTGKKSNWNSNNVQQINPIFSSVSVSIIVPWYSKRSVPNNWEIMIIYMVWDEGSYIQNGLQYLQYLLSISNHSITTTVLILHQSITTDIGRRLPAFCRHWWLHNLE